MKLDAQGTGISCYGAAEYGDCSIHVPYLFLWPPSPRFLRGQSKQPGLYFEKPCPCFSLRISSSWEIFALRFGYKGMNRKNDNMRGDQGCHQLVYLKNTTDATNEQSLGEPHFLHRAWRPLRSPGPTPEDLPGAF